MSRIIRHPLNGTRDDFGWRYLDTQNNLTMPWYTIGCLEWLITLNLSELSVFEYGCGLSSLWWKKNCKRWYGVDIDPKWGNDALITTDKKIYTEASNKDTYDIIVIDGSFRDDCTEHALNSINNDGYIICDNWDQATTNTDGDYWIKTKKILNKYNQIVYKEPLHIDWKTTVFEIG